MDLQQLGKILVLIAVALALLGGMLWILGRAGMGARIGHLPGDIRIQGESWSCFVPITTSILLSVLLTLILTLIVRFWR